MLDIWPRLSFENTASAMLKVLESLTRYGNGGDESFPNEHEMR